MKLKNLKTNFLGRNNIYYKEIDSTQSEVLRLIDKKASNGTLVMADIQTAGSGTHGRVWHTDKENNIAFSFFIEQNCNAKKLEGITLKIAEIIVQIFDELYSIKLNIKFPNDIVYNNKKIGGILTQTKMVGENVKYLVIGIGINTSQTEFVEDIKNIASSIKNEFEVNVDVEDFITTFCNKFEQVLIQIMHEN